MRTLCIEEFNKEYGLNNILKSKKKGRNVDINVNDMDNYTLMKEQLEKNQQKLEKANRSSIELKEQSSDIKELVQELKNVPLSKNNYILKEEDKFSIASVYKIEPEEMEDYLPILANYRNLCAHEDVTFDHFTQRMIPDTKYHSILNIQKIDGEYINGKNDIFALIIILKRLLTDVDFKMMMNEINYELDRLSGKLNSIKIDDVIEKMGFPSNYKDIMYLD